LQSNALSSGRAGADRRGAGAPAPAPAPAAACGARCAAAANATSLLARAGLVSCPQQEELGTSQTIWKGGGASPSCTGTPRNDGAFTCTQDPTSIYVDMGSVADKIGCFEWVSSCTFQMLSVKQIDFDVEWEDCDSLWMAPFWTYSSPWMAPQGKSGEIDLVEACPVPSVKTNLGCYNADVGDNCYDATAWGSGSSSGGPKHLTMTLEGGQLEVNVCWADGTNCKRVAYYRDYINLVYPTSGGRNNPYHLVSDVWNGGPGDGGWSGCNAEQNPSTQCRFAVTNIQFTSNSEAPVFGDFTDVCWSLNSQGDREMVSKQRAKAEPIAHTA